MDVHTKRTLSEQSVEVLMKHIVYLVALKLEQDFEILFNPNDIFFYEMSQRLLNNLTAVESLEEISFGHTIFHEFGMFQPNTSLQRHVDRRQRR